MNWLQKISIDFQLPSDFDTAELGSCMRAAELAVRGLLEQGIEDFVVVEGWISFGFDEDSDWAHTWIERGDKIWDPTKEQFAAMGYDLNDMEYVRIKDTYTPREYLQLCDKHPEPEGG